MGVPTVAQCVKNSSSTHEYVGSISGLAQDLALLQAVVWVADAARIWHCCVCGVEQGLQLQFDP